MEIYNAGKGELAELKNRRPIRHAVVILLCFPFIGISKVILINHIIFIVSPFASISGLLHFVCLCVFRYTGIVFYITDTYKWQNADLII